MRIGSAAAAAFTPAELSPAVWLEMDSSGTLRGDPSGNTYTGDLSDEAAVAAAMDGGDAEFLTEWEDLSGNGRDFAQAMAANQPAWVTDAETDFDTPAIDFVSSDILSNGTGLANIATSGIGITVVFIADDVTTQSHIFNTQATTTHRAHFAIQSGALCGAVTTTTNGAASGTVSIATKYVAHYNYNGTAGSMRINGVAQVGTANVNNAPADTGMRIGARRPSLDQPFNGRIVAVIARASPWTTGEMDSLDTYLAAKYGVTL